MKAAIFSETGGPDVIRIEDVPTPEPGPREVRVRVRAASLNHLDLWVRRGLPVETTMPHIGGSDIAGEVDAVGSGVAEISEGTRVVVDPSLDYEMYEGWQRSPNLPAPRFRLIGEHTQGGFAEYAVVPARNLVELPDGFPFEDAAAAGLVGVTAWRGLLHRGGLHAGEAVLVTGGSGGVGSMGIQVARLAGARVYAVTSGPEAARRCQALGADVAFDRLETDFDAAVRDETRGRGVDVILDSVGEEIWDACLNSLAVGGRLVTYGATTGREGKTDLARVFWKQLSILGSTMGTHAQYRGFMAALFAERVRAVVDERMPLDAVRRGHERLEAGEVFGKIVIVP